MTKPVKDYKSLVQELQELLVAMQSDELDVDAALKCYERGQQLIEELDDYLKTAENKIVHHKLRRDVVE